MLFSFLRERPLLLSQTTAWQRIGVDAILRLSDEHGPVVQACEVQLMDCNQLSSLTKSQMGLKI